MASAYPADAMIVAMAKWVPYRVAADAGVHHWKGYLANGVYVGVLRSHWAPRCRHDSYWQWDAEVPGIAKARFETFEAAAEYAVERAAARQGMLL